jgi:hypothetical protein
MVAIEFPQALLDVDQGAVAAKDAMLRLGREAGVRTRRLRRLTADGYGHTNRPDRQEVASSDGQERWSGARIEW